MMANILMCVLVGAAGGVYNDEFARAAKSYEAGDYATAIGVYEQMVGESVAHEALFYNLGNAYYRSGRLGAAVANYERALDLDPGFENARENLEKAVRETQQHLARPLPSDWEQSLLFWHYLVSRETTTRLALLFWLGFWVALGVRQLRPLRYTRRAASVFAVLALAFGGSAWAKAHAPALAVADTDAPVTYGTSETDAVRFDLHPGDRVTVDQRRDGWARVKTASGEHGWTRDGNLILVGPPYMRMDLTQQPASGNTTAPEEKKTSAS